MCVFPFSLLFILLKNSDKVVNMFLIRKKCIKFYPYKQIISLNSILFLRRFISSYQFIILTNYIASLGAYLKSHILRTHESHKMKDIKCTQCDFVTKFSTYLKRHKERVHNKTGVPHFCTELDCDFQTTLTEHLRRHIDRMHKIAASPCDKCEYVAKNPYELKTHKKSHNLLQCDQCSYSTVGTNYIGFKSHLEQHQAAEEGVKYSCTQCDHIANSQGRHGNSQ